jgi:acetyl esterase/lipase
VLLHGGGWSAGAPSWTFDAARRFSSWGLVAIAAQYRLSSGDVTPLDALEDVCAALGWVRAHRRELRLTERLAGYGVSAGGHLITATSTMGCSTGEPGPDALLLLSPALDVARDQWFAHLLKGRGTASSMSPIEHVRRSTPPTSIVQGAADALTPRSGADRYCALLRQHGQTCDLNVYPGLGHLLTRNLKDQETTFDPDPKARADGMERHRRFLQQLGFLPVR